MILPYFGIITEIISTFSRKPVFGYTGLVLASMAIAGLSMGVWAHHMFTTGATVDPFFAATSFLIGVPTGIKFFNWIGTMWGGKLTFPTPMLFSIGFLLNFLIGGITGVMVGAPPIDFQARDSYFLVSHFHYTLGGGSLFALFAALYFWWPKFFGFMLGEKLGKWHFWLLFLGFNMTFLPQQFLGVMGMTRRIYTYPDLPGWSFLNGISTIGCLHTSDRGALLRANLILSIRARKPAGDNPWDAFTLEWATTSPPPELNFNFMPPIRSERPTFDMNHPDVGKRHAPVSLAVRLFVSSMLFAIGIAGAYAWATHELIGTILLGMMAIAMITVAVYIVIAEKESNLAADAPDVDPRDLAGENLGSFTLESYWPILGAAGTVLLVQGVVFLPGDGGRRIADRGVATLLLDPLLDSREHGESELSSRKNAITFGQDTVARNRPAHASASSSAS